MEAAKILPASRTNDSYLKKDSLPTPLSGAKLLQPKSSISAEPGFSGTDPLKPSEESILGGVKLDDESRALKNLEVTLVLYQQFNDSGVAKVDRTSIRNHLDEVAANKQTRVFLHQTIPDQNYSSQLGGLQSSMIMTMTKSHSPPKMSTTTEPAQDTRYQSSRKSDMLLGNTQPHSASLGLEELAGAGTSRSNSTGPNPSKPEQTPQKKIFQSAILTQSETNPSNSLKNPPEGQDKGTNQKGLDAHGFQLKSRAKGIFSGMSSLQTPAEVKATKSPESPVPSSVGISSSLPLPIMSPKPARDRAFVNWGDNNGTKNDAPTGISVLETKSTAKVDPGDIVSVPKPENKKSQADKLVNKESKMIPELEVPSKFVTPANRAKQVVDTKSNQAVAEELASSIIPDIKSSCFCGKNNKDGEGFLTCSKSSTCQGKCHKSCVEWNQSELGPFECPSCLILNNDPMREVVTPLIGPALLEPEATFTFRIALPKSCPLPTGRGKALPQPVYDVEMRCIRLSGPRTYLQSWPKNIKLTLNSTNIFDSIYEDQSEWYKQGKEAIKLRNLVSNINSVQKHSNYTLKIESASDLNNKYLFCVCLVRRHCIRSFCKKITTDHCLDYKEAQKKLIRLVYGPQPAKGHKTKNYSEAAMANTKTIDLRCFATKTLLKRPVRGVYCTHSEAVSLDYLAAKMENSNGIPWECVVCGKPCYKLELDSRLDKIVEDSRKRSFKPVMCYYNKDGQMSYIKPDGHENDQKSRTKSKSRSDSSSIVETQEEEQNEHEVEEEDPKQPSNRRNRFQPIHRSITTRNSKGRQMIENPKPAKKNSRRKPKPPSEAISSSRSSDSRSSDDDEEGGEEETKNSGQSEMSQESSNSAESDRVRRRSNHNHRSRRHYRDSDHDDIRKTLRRRRSPVINANDKLFMGRGGFWYHKKNLGKIPPPDSRL
jgi:hypothetical protein